MPNDVTLVIPGRNCAATLAACLEAAVKLKQAGDVKEIILVNDGSTDETGAIASSFDVVVLAGLGRGAAAARNVGWRQAQTSLIWFVDSDCVIEPDALGKLLPHMADESVGAVGGSYLNLRPESLVAWLIHEEIAARHATMPADVDFLGGFNVLYRRKVLEQVDGFDERYPAATAEDADLSFRVRKAGFALRFEPQSLVGHYHETRLIRYLKTQRRHGIWRVHLHKTHRGEGMSNAYSGFLDHLQPPLAMAAIMSVPLAASVAPWWTPITLFVSLQLLQMPMALRLFRRTRSPRSFLFAGLGFHRSFWRGVGMIQGLVGTVRTRT